MNFCSGSKGIGPHSKILSFMITIGAICALFINFISDSRMEKYSLTSRFSLIIIFENIVFVMMMFMQIAKLPTWFDFKNRIKISYVKALQSFFHTECNKNIEKIIKTVKEDDELDDELNE